MSQTETNRVEPARLVREYDATEAAKPLLGAAFDHRNVWLASGRYLLHVVPQTGRVFEQLETSPDVGGLAFDGHNLWQRSRGRLEQIDPRTGLALRQVVPGVEDIVGIACIEGDLLLLHARGHRLSRIRIHQPYGDEPIVVSESEPIVNAARGLTWAGGDLWSATANALVRIDPLTGHLLERLQVPDGIEVVDLAADSEGHLWCVDGRSHRVRIFAAPRREPGSHAQSPPSSRVVDVTTAGPLPAGVDAPAPVADATFSRILIPVDFSAGSRRALALALLLQDRMQSQVHLFHLAQSGANASFLAGAGAPLGLGGLAGDARARLIRFVDNVFPGCSGKVTVHAAVGSELARAIEACAVDIGATLVILTRPARRHITRARVESVARDLKCAVMELPAE